MTAPRSPHQNASLKRLERKVDSLSERIDTINLNGSAPALKRVADNADQLLELARVAPIIIAAVERDADMAAFWRVTRRLLNPLKPAGALAWTIVGTIAAALIWNLFTHH